MKITREQLFKRQTTLQEVGQEGQQKLQNAKVLIVGCGGLGSQIAVYLAASGIGKIHLVDFDTVDVTNLHRQVFYCLDDVGRSKAKTLSEFIKKRAPFIAVTFTNEPIIKSNVFELIENYDIVVDGTDSLPTKYVLNDACVLKGKPLVYGSLYKFDGYVATFNVLQKDGSYSVNLRDAFPIMATDVLNCEEAGTLNAIVSMVASQQVNEVLKLILNTGNLLINQLLVYNFLENLQLKMKLENKVSKDDIQQFFDNEIYFDASCEIRNEDWLISADELKKAISGRAELRPILISVIVNQEIEYPFKVDKNIPLSELLSSSFVPQENRKYVMICMKGNLSYRAAKVLKGKYPKATILSLVGGVSEFN